jgi:carboxypeptidase Q
MGATTVAMRTTGGTDHVYMQTVGLPGFQFIQDPLDYGTRLHHSNLDTARPHASRRPASGRGDHGPSC